MSPHWEYTPVEELVELLACKGPPTLLSRLGTLIIEYFNLTLEVAIILNIRGEAVTRLFFTARMDVAVAFTRVDASWLFQPTLFRVAGHASTIQLCAHSSKLLLQDIYHTGPAGQQATGRFELTLRGVNARARPLKSIIQWLGISSLPIPVHVTFSTTSLTSYSAFDGAIRDEELLALTSLTLVAKLVLEFSHSGSSK